MTYQVTFGYSHYDKKLIENENINLFLQSDHMSSQCDVFDQCVKKHGHTLDVVAVTSINYSVRIM